MRQGEKLNNHAIKVFRTTLILVGMVLLIIFGGLAVSQARNKKLAGAAHPSVYRAGSSAGGLRVLTATQSQLLAVEPAVASVASQTSSLNPTVSERARAPQTVVSPGAGRVSPTNQMTTPSLPDTVALRQSQNTQKNLTSTVTATTKQVEKTVNDTTHALAGNDFLSLWP